MDQGYNSELQCRHGVQTIHNLCMSLATWIHCGCQLVVKTLSSLHIPLHVRGKFLKNRVRTNYIATLDKFYCFYCLAIAPVSNDEIIAYRSTLSYHISSAIQRSTLPNILKPLRHHRMTQIDILLFIPCGSRYLKYSR